MERVLPCGSAGIKPACRFRHRLGFWASNLSGIVSMQMHNFQASFKQPPGDKDGYFWGWYSLLISYQRYADAYEMRQKRFTRGFFAKVPYTYTGLAEGMRGKYICIPTYSYQITPLVLMLFPLFSRLNFVPFRVEVRVHGAVHESTDMEVAEKSNGPGETALVREGEQAEKKGEEQTEGETKEVTAVPKDEPVDLDLLPLEQPAYVEMQSDGSEYSRNNPLYYNLLRRHEEDIGPGKKEMAD